MKDAINVKNGNNSVMRFIRGMLYLSMFAVFSMDLIMENQVNFMYIFSNIALLYFISD